MSKIMHHMHPLPLTNGTMNFVDTLKAALAAGLHVTYTPGHSLDVSNNDTSLIAAAVAAAKDADIAVVMVGLCADHCVLCSGVSGNPVLEDMLLCISKGFIRVGGGGGSYVHRQRICLGAIDQSMSSLRGSFL
jgi:hypothetical protein